MICFRLLDLLSLKRASRDSSHRFFASAPVLPRRRQTRHRRGKPVGKHVEGREAEVARRGCAVFCCGGVEVRFFLFIFYFEGEI
jgi:hypothetical protein